MSDGVLGQEGAAFKRGGVDGSLILEAHAEVVFEDRLMLCGIITIRTAGVREVRRRNQPNDFACRQVHVDRLGDLEDQCPVIVFFSVHGGEDVADVFFFEFSAHENGGSASDAVGLNEG